MKTTHIAISFSTILAIAVSVIPSAINAKVVKKNGDKVSHSVKAAKKLAKTVADKEVDTIISKNRNIGNFKKGLPGITRLRPFQAIRFISLTL